MDGFVDGVVFFVNFQSFYNSKSPQNQPTLIFFPAKRFVRGVFLPYVAKGSGHPGVPLYFEDEYCTRSKRCFEINGI